ncbi:MAG: 3-dehydroquinate synthase [Gammaproteobacteria bacterium]|nr:3-dehydroquinate synthase [Gammaproteobacteria bacterium]|tara:strand:- start:96796 stop:97872 length:1077 start_codon:yes stop_codon:yes gene_type:complete
MNRLSLKTENQKVTILTGNKILNKINFKNFINGNDICILSNSKIAKLYLQQLKKKLNNFKINTFLIPDGEKYKSVNILNKIHDHLIKNKFDRHLTIIALGGGVIGDLAGLAADTFLRGVNLIHIPTTLLAQVDSSIGGKTGVNHRLGKNLIGTFKHPSAIIIDINFLKTLPDKQFKSGLAEVIKYGAISNRSFLNWVNKNSNKILNQNTDSLLKIINFSIKAKIKIVELDERESGVRAYLNFGHTFGHAIESAKNYKGILHGEAISLGMILAAAISMEKTNLSLEDFNLIEETIRKIKLPTNLPKNLSKSKIIKYLQYDKKKKLGRNNFILLKSVGSCCVSNTITTKYLIDILDSFRN